MNKITEKQSIKKSISDIEKSISTNKNIIAIRWMLRILYVLCSLILIAVFILSMLHVSSVSNDNHLSDRKEYTNKIKKKIEYIISNELNNIKRKVSIFNESYNYEELSKSYQAPQFTPKDEKYLYLEKSIKQNPASASLFINNKVFNSQYIQKKLSDLVSISNSTMHILQKYTMGSSITFISKYDFFTSFPSFLTKDSIKTFNPLLTPQYLNLAPKLKTRPKGFWLENTKYGQKKYPLSYCDAKYNLLNFLGSTCINLSPKYIDHISHYLQKILTDEYTIYVMDSKENILLTNDNSKKLLNLKDVNKYKTILKSYYNFNKIFVNNNTIITSSYIKDSPIIFTLIEKRSPIKIAEKQQTNVILLSSVIVILMMLTVFIIAKIWISNPLMIMVWFVEQSSTKYSKDLFELIKHSKQVKGAWLPLFRYINKRMLMAHKSREQIKEKLIKINAYYSSEEQFFLDLLKLKKDKAPFSIGILSLREKEKLKHLLNEQQFYSLIDKLTTRIRGNELYSNLKLYLTLNKDILIIFKKTESKKEVEKYCKEIEETTNEIEDIGGMVIELKSYLGAIHMTNDININMVKETLYLLLEHIKYYSLQYKVLDFNLLLKIRNTFQQKYEFIKRPSNNDLFIYYKPLIDTKTDSLEMLIATIKWDYKNNKKLIDIEDIVDENNIVDIEEWKIKQSIQEIKDIYLKSAVVNNIVFNTNRQLLSHKDFLPTIYKEIKEIDISAKHINLIVDAQDVINISNRSRIRLKTSSSKGVNLLISNITTQIEHIRSLILYEPKFFVITAQEITDLKIRDNYKKDILELIIKIAKQNNIKVCALDVRDKRSIDILKELGVSIIHNKNTEMNKTEVLKYQKSLTK